MAIAELVAQMRKTLEYHQGTLSFQIPHYLRHAIFWRNLDAHMDMVHTHAFASTISIPLYSHSFLRISPIVLRYLPYISLRLNFGEKTM